MCVLKKSRYLCVTKQRMVSELSWIERQPSKLWVLGSNPSPITIKPLLMYITHQQRFFYA